ncbi:2-amino-4-hydroxy-6-hydroxymethyldihydropteridine diphosphokinase [Anaerostipes sp.]|uniref:2-amino-4-hydroxy-6- hydroxymethyldihydropteridine diphosphokinase n=1 Tax=Anaerostipes sp. TaxID=1872530 RepID=UPI0025C3B6EC|nr:2-amino-4-hydroxy-6-hydroxymethyldihydropteridine diphosphokinase [Anaerostipes sp.]MBS7007660.1 2-amino-4-hydroxy-6-hydroxymethyldihydropteridine diphosphokinase [Anaerostipes sp.]
MDQIIIKELEIYSNHGVYKEEKVLGQKFLVSAVLYTDTKRAGASDKIEDSVNYGDVCHRIRDIMEGNTFDLIERAAETIAERLLIKYDLIKEVEVEVKKPWAPIGLPIQSVAVKIKRKWSRAYIGVGSNMGDRAEYIKQAVKQVDHEDDTRVMCVSSLLETEPYGNVDQDPFINGCIGIDTLKSPAELLEFLQGLESRAGRERTVHWGPRTLDLDILLYEDLILNEQHLKIPHIEIPKRQFVLEPLAQIAPHVRHPVLNRTILELKEALEEKES